MNDWEERLIRMEEILTAIEKRIVKIEENDLPHIWRWVQALFFTINATLAIGVIVAVLRLTGVW